ncbi:Uncharacterised protein [Mycobacterium tuberculosis]|nr:Uncharacterised protein [Mycobacterium tuberculosis]
MRGYHTFIIQRDALRGGQNIQCIRIQHLWFTGLHKCRFRQYPALCTLPQSGAGNLCGQRRVIRKGAGSTQHQLRCILNKRHRQLRLIKSQDHFAAPGFQCGASGQNNRTGHSGSPAGDPEGTECTFMAVLRIRPF